MKNPAVNFGRRALAQLLVLGAIAGKVVAAQDDDWDVPPFVTHPPPAPGERTGPAPFPPPEASAMTNMVMRPVGPGVFELGKVKFNKSERSVSFPAVLNQRGGLIEYFLVTTYGKTHESIFRTEAEPYHLHLAMLLLDAKGAGKNGPGPGAGGPIERPGPPPILGDKVALEVSWTADGKTIRRAADELVFNQAEHAAMKRGSWVYNGSMVVDGMFVAQRDGSMISLIADPYALINNPRTGAENDEIWTTQTNTLPLVNTPVEITIKLNPAAKSQPSKPKSGS